MVRAHVGPQREAEKASLFCLLQITLTPTKDFLRNLGKILTTQQSELYCFLKEPVVKNGYWQEQNEITSYITLLSRFSVRTILLLSSNFELC